MKVAIVGSSGFIARHLINRLLYESNIDDILKIDLINSDYLLDLNNSELFDYSVLEDVEYVVFTAAVSSPDICAKDFSGCWNINVNGTIRFISKAINRNCKIIFFSSDAVFGNIPNTIFTEKSNTNADTPYGRMKKAVEDEFKDDNSFKAVRLSYVASLNDKFVSYCINCINSNETAEVFHPFYRNVITVSDVIEVIIYLFSEWKSFSPTFLNVSGTELVSRVRIADEINRYCSGKLKYKIINPDIEFFSNRHCITQMESVYLYKNGILSQKSFSEKFFNELKGLLQ